MDIRNFGSKSIEEVKDKLRSLGLALKDSPAGFVPGIRRGRGRGLRRGRAALRSHRPSSNLSQSVGVSYAHAQKGPRLASTPAHERLLLANLATALFEHGAITTTEARAKRVRPLAERMITFAKRGDLHARRQVMTVIRDKSVVHVLFDRDRAALRDPSRRLHPHHQDRAAQGRQRPHGRDRAVRAAGRARRRRGHGSNPAGRRRDDRRNRRPQPTRSRPTSAVEAVEAGEAVEARLSRPSRRRRR